jgi:hypothetical protein
MSMKHHILRLSLLSIAATAGVTVLALAGALVVGFFVENWRPDWSFVGSLIDVLSEAPQAGEPARPPVPPAQAFLDGVWIWGLAVAAPFAWYMLIWSLYGRDPLPGVAFPRFHPPDGLSPATVRQIVGMGFDEKAMAAELLSLAVRGHVRVIRTKRGLYGLRRTDKGPGQLTAAERHLMAGMFRGVTEIVIGRQQGVRLRVAMEAFQKRLEDELEGPVYATNVGATLTGVMISGGAFMVAAMSYRDAALGNVELAMAGAALLLIGAMNALFFTLMKAPTALGRGLLDEIAGFRMFLATADHERMKLADAPDMSEHLYAMHLPYALALDLELAWSDRFSTLLKRAIPDPMDYEWYASGGDETFSNGLVGMASALGAAIASAFEKDDGRPE